MNRKKTFLGYKTFRVESYNCMRFGARREIGLSPSVKYFYWPFQGRASFVDHLCYFCLVFCYSFVY